MTHEPGYQIDGLLHLNVVEFDGVEQVHLRRWYPNGKPSRHGVVMRPEQWDGLVARIRQLDQYVRSRRRQLAGEIAEGRLVEEMGGETPPPKDG